MYAKDKQVKGKKLAAEMDALTTLLSQGGGRREGVGQTIEKINYIIK